MFTIYDLIYVMDNFPYEVIIQNDAEIDDGRENYEKFKGDVTDLKYSDEWDELQYKEVTDIFTYKNGDMYICYNEEEAEDPTQGDEIRTPWGGLVD